MQIKAITLNEINNDSLSHNSVKKYRFLKYLTDLVQAGSDLYLT